MFCINKVIYFSLCSDTERLSDSGAGQWQILESQETFGALLRSDQGPADTSSAAAAPASAQVARSTSRRTVTYYWAPEGNSSLSLYSHSFEFNLQLYMKRDVWEMYRFLGLLSATFADVRDSAGKPRD